MRYGMSGAVVPMLFESVVLGVLRGIKGFKELNFRDKLKAEYGAMVARTEKIGSTRVNPYARLRYLACYLMACRKADPTHVDRQVFSALVKAVCASGALPMYLGREDLFSEKLKRRYEKAAERSSARKYRGDWVFEVQYDGDTEMTMIHRECGLCKLATQENQTAIADVLCELETAFLACQGGDVHAVSSIGDHDDRCEFRVKKARVKA